MQRRRETGRGEKVLPGVWRLRLPLPWPGVPHCNAWALASGDGITLVDAGMQLPDSWQQLELALRQCGLRVEDVRHVVCTHAHADHCGQAADVKARAGAEIWLHPDSGHLLAQADDPGAQIARRVEIARASGVPDAPLRRWAEERRIEPLGVALPLDVDHDLVDGVTIATDAGDWHVLETPGHAPSHIVLHQPERRLLLSGDHVLGRVSLYFDYGYRPDPVGDFLRSLDRVRNLDVRLTLSGHGKPFTDLRGHVDGSRRLVEETLEDMRAALAGGADTAYDVARSVYRDAWQAGTATWLLSLTLAHLAHLEARGEALRRADGDGRERWSAQRLGAGAAPGS